ncbi:protein of unknown function [Caloramator quimbayensis]|uniref:DUF1836 domain-containing protein n=1 Tax=Caloramator quimbayensis TaxID=1147123 RepID=A0A1T4XZW2_9CLOT|nr:DUF1836 domain-containing protein [Caloramator quimbayensis]SKA95070.1 protein of unknown function [Caloramator quimbayensis]
MNDIDKILEMAKGFNIIGYEDLPLYDLYLSQVTDFLNDKFDGNFTNNIIQNYIKSQIISKPEDGKKRGYTKDHIIQLILLSYMRPILSAEEIKDVFNLAFNDINISTDDILTWENTYKIFTELQKESLKNFTEKNKQIKEKLTKIIKENNINEENFERIFVFLTVLNLIAQASTCKKMAERIVDDYMKK